jgi:hypothetical protein
MIASMTKHDRALERLAQLPPQRQAEIVDILSDLVEADVHATPWQLEELGRRRADPDDFASDEEVEAFFARLES